MVKHTNSPDVFTIIIDEDAFYDPEFMVKHSSIDNPYDLIFILLAEKRAFSVKYEPADFADSYFERNDCMIFS